MLTAVVDDRAFRERLALLQGKLGDLSELLAGIGQELEARISARFETERDPSGRDRAQWAPNTRKGYPKDGNRRILGRYGNTLGSSLSWQADAASVRVGLVRRSLLFANPDAGTLSEDDERAVLDVLEGFLSADF